MITALPQDHDFVDIIDLTEPRGILRGNGQPYMGIGADRFLRIRPAILPIFQHQANMLADMKWKYLLNAQHDEKAFMRALVWQAPTPMAEPNAVNLVPSPHDPHDLVLVAQFERFLPLCIRLTQAQQDRIGLSSRHRLSHLIH